VGRYGAPENADWCHVVTVTRFWYQTSRVLCSECTRFICGV